MGGRIGCHLSLGENIPALICLGYPLCGGGDPNKMRDKTLRQIIAPILFVQGTRDPLCPLHLLDQVRKEMRAPNELLIVDGGDHSLGILKRSGRTQSEVDAQILEAIRSFVQRHC